MDRNHFLSVEIGGTKLQVASGNGQGEIRRKVCIPVYPAKSAEEILSKLENPILELIGKDQPSKIGIGYGGPIDRKKGKVICSHQISGWEDFKLRQWFEEKFSLPTIIENDANVAALGEAVCGAGKGYTNCFYITLGSGVGAGFIQDGQILHGQYPTESEFGHIRLNKSGTTVESQCSGWAIDNQLLQACQKSSNKGFMESIESYHEKKGHRGGEASLLLKLIEDNVDEARAILEDLSDNLSFALSHVIHLLNPDAVILGGGLSKLGNPLIDRIKTRLRDYTMNAISELPHLATTELGDEVVPSGGLILASQYFYHSEAGG